jgi:hypothetical protein
MRVVFSPRYEVTLPGHVWPTSKYRLVAEALRSQMDPSDLTFIDAPLASWHDLALVHTSDYLVKLRDNTLTADDVATLELPWRPEFADAFRLMVGGTCAAAAAALDDGRAAHLGGGLRLPRTVRVFVRSTTSRSRFARCSAMGEFGAPPLSISTSITATARR